MQAKDCNHKEQFYSKRYYLETYLLDTLYEITAGQQWLLAFLEHPYDISWIPMWNNFKIYIITIKDYFNIFKSRVNSLPTKDCNDKK